MQKLFPSFTESPTKKSKLETGGQSGSGDGKEMDIQESFEALEKNEEQELDIAQDSSCVIREQTSCKGEDVCCILSLSINLLRFT